MWSLSGRDAPVFKCAVAESMLCVAASRDGTLIAGGGVSGKTFLWDALSGDLLRVWNAHYKGVSAVVFLPGSGGICTGGQDGIIHVWDVASLIDVAVAGDVSMSPTPYVTWTEHSLPVTSLRCGAGFRATELLVSASADRTVRLWHVPSKRCVLRVSLPAGVNVADVDSAGHRLFAGCSDGVVYAVGIDAAAAADAAPDARLHRTPVNSTSEGWLLGNNAAAAAAGTASSSPSSSSGAMPPMTVELGAAAAARPDAYVGHTASVSDLVVSVDGASVVSGGDDGTLRVWDVRSGRQVHCSTALHKGPIAGLLLLPRHSKQQALGRGGSDSSAASSSSSSTSASQLRQQQHTLAPLKKHHVPLPAEWRGSTTGPTGRDMAVTCVPHLPDEHAVVSMNRSFREAVAAIAMAVHQIGGVAQSSGCSNASSHGHSALPSESETQPQQQQQRREHVHSGATADGASSLSATTAASAADAETIAGLRTRVALLESEAVRWKSVNNTLLSRLQMQQL